MEHIIARQNSAAKPATGKTFLLGVARIVLELAIAQLIVNFLIKASGNGILNLLFYLYAVVLLVRFMTRTVAGCIYTLKDESLVLQRLLGDSTVLGVEIPLERIVSVRPIVCGERLHLDYRQVTYVDPTCAPGLRMRAAFGASLLSARLARLIAGKKAQKPNGYVVVYLEEEKRRACAFRPDASFAAALEGALEGAFGVDERLTLPPRKSYWAYSLHRAFASLYPHVPPMVTEEELAFEKEEFAKEREETIACASKYLKIPEKKSRAFFTRWDRFCAAVKRCLNRPWRIGGAGRASGGESAPGKPARDARKDEKDAPARRRRGKKE